MENNYVQLSLQISCFILTSEITPPTYFLLFYARWAIFRFFSLQSIMFVNRQKNIYFPGWDKILGCLLLQSPKFYNNGVTTLGTFIIFGLVRQVEVVQTFLPLIIIYIRGNIVYHHWGVHQFIGHCLNLQIPVRIYNIHIKACSLPIFKWV